MSKKKYDRTRGGALKPIQLLTTGEDHRRLRMAAAAAGVPMTRFVLDAALSAAKKSLENLSNPH